MKLLTLALCALVSTTLAIPIEQASSETTDLIVDCPIRPELGAVSASLCADTDWLGYCHVFVTCEGSCFDVVDYGVAGMFGDGISSVMFPVGQSCKFFSGRNCDWNDGPWDGSFWGQRDVDWFADGPNDPNPRHSALNNKIRSFMCSHATPSETKREDVALEVIEERGEPSSEVLEKPADPESAEVATTLLSTRIPGQTFNVDTCTSRDYIDCYLWSGMTDGECLAGKDNRNLAHTKSMILRKNQQCVLYRNSQACSGDNVIITLSEPRLDYFPNEGGVTANIENQVGSLLCCVGISNKEGCNGSCLCDVGLTPEPGVPGRTIDINEAEFNPINANSIAVRSVPSASSIVGQPMTSEDTDDVPVRSQQKASSVIGHPTTSNRTEDVPRFSLQTCIDREYGSCALWPGLFNGLCMNDPGHLALLISTKSIKLLENQSCVLYKAMDCVGENVIITKSEPRLDYFPNEGGVTADMEGKISSVWCCQGPGHQSCDNTCLCYQGVTLEPGGNRRMLERSPLLDV